jgi:hypothetical protein
LDGSQTVVHIFEFKLFRLFAHKRKCPQRAAVKQQAKKTTLRLRSPKACKAPLRAWAFMIIGGRPFHAAKLSASQFLQPES